MYVYERYGIVEHLLALALRLGGRQIGDLCLLGPRKKEGFVKECRERGISSILKGVIYHHGKSQIWICQKIFFSSLSSNLPLRHSNKYTFSTYTHTCILNDLPPSHASSRIHNMYCTVLLSRLPLIVDTFITNNLVYHILSTIFNLLSLSLTIFNHDFNT